MIFTEGNPANTWVKERYKDKTEKELDDSGILFLEVKTEENKSNLPEDYIDILKANYPKQYIERYLYGGWDQIDEMVFSEFRDYNNLIDPICKPENWEIVMGGDSGYINPAAFIWLTVDYDGKIIIWDEWQENKQSIQAIAKAGKRHGNYPVIYDFSAKRPDRDGKSVWTELLNEGLILVESNKDELRNINVANSMFKQKKLLVCRNCVQTIRQIKNYKWQRLKLNSQKDLSEIPIDKENHLCDSMLYALAYITDLHSTPPDDIDPTKTLAYYNTRKRSPHAW